MDVLFQRNQCLSFSLSDPRLTLGSVDINNFSVINMSGEPRLATNHTTIKTLIYCRPAPGGWLSSKAGPGLSRNSQWSVVTTAHPMWDGIV